MSTPLEIPFTEIQSITNDFSDEIGKGFFGSIYKGQLSQSGESIDVAVRRLDYSFYLQEIAFDKEISVLSSLKHENIVSILGFCYENNHEMIIVNKREARGSLKPHLSGSKLTWMQRLKISVGVASALSYLHNASVMHHNVNSTSILLDENWEAKLSGFEYSMRIPARHLDLAYEKLGIGSYKSDVFSFGILLFEILCGPKAFIADDGNFQAPLAIFRHENRKLHELVDPDLFSQMDPQSFNIFSETACYCLKEQRPQPSMNQVFKRLERALRFQQKHENPVREHSVAVERTLSPHLTLMLKNLKHMRVQLNDILKATDNFASKYCIVSGGFGTVYKAKLDHVDKEYCCPKEGESGRELPKRCSEVAIKRIFHTEDESGEQGFYAEIEMLTKCKHSNILTLHGFCDEDSAMILIYEYATNGSLADYLQNKNNIRNDNWAQRMKICLDAAKGLSCLHTSEGDRQEIVHRDIKSDNILLGKNFDAKIGDFGLSKFLSAYEEHSGVAGTRVYIDPQYLHEAKLKKQIDVYSFGIVLFEALCGTLAYDPIYSNKGLAIIAQQHVYNGTVMNIIDLKIKDGTTKTRFTSIKGPDQDSVDAFSKIAYCCLDGRQENRPTMEVVIEELEKAILLQENRKEIFQVPLQLIKSATNDFGDKKLSDRGEYWKAYEGKILHDGKVMSFGVKRLDTSHHESEVSFLRELKILIKYKHESLIGLVGYCDEMDEKIILYDTLCDSNRNLASYVIFRQFTWMNWIEVCLMIASGLEFLHGGLVTEEIVIHGDISSRKIVWDRNGSYTEAKIAGFEHSVILPINQETVLSVKCNACTYTEPEYAHTGLLSKECDIYSFGVVLCDIMFEYPAYYFPDDHLGRLTKKGTLDELLLECETDVAKSQSLPILHMIAVQCLQPQRQARPTASEVLTQLREALKIHVDAARFKRHNQFNFSLDEIKSATDKFSDERCIGGGRSGKVYTGQLPHANGPKIIAAKRFATGLGQENDAFDREFHILAMLKHENIIKIEGYCEELDENILLYEYASKGSLDQWLNKDDLTWMKRLAICIDIASGLEFINEGFSNNVYVIHKSIKSSNILLSGDWKAKISDFEFHEILDKDSKTTNWRAKHYDIYPFGGVLLEILCGRLVCSDDNDLRLIAKRCFEEGKVDGMVFEGIKGTVGPKSYDTFSKIAHQCLDPDSDKRPLASEVLVQLQRALEYQEDYEIWEPKLPTDYQRLIQMSKNAKINSNIKKKDLGDILFSEGILLRVGEVSISFDKNKRSKEVISARMFCYKNPTLLKWKLIPKSRFHKVAMMLDVSNLMIQIKIKTQFLSPNVNYGVHLIFKFGDRKKVPSKLMYVNLKYTMHNETMHAYFAEQRDDKWLQIELFRFFNHNEETDFEVLLESFSKYYCGSGVVYIEGIEFRAIDNVKLEEMDKSRESQQVLKLSSNMDQVERLSLDYVKENHGELFNEEYFLISEVDGKKLYMVCALYFLDYNIDDDRLKVKFLKRKPSEQSRFPVVIELLPQQVRRVKFRIENERLSPNTDYTCFMVFKLSEKCRGLHCPMKVRRNQLHHDNKEIKTLIPKVRNQLHHNKKEIETLYFRTPTPWNVHNMQQVSRQREDEWMEVSVWKFNSTVELMDDENISIDLKLICYEGTMAGLILYGLEFRPM